MSLETMKNQIVASGFVKEAEALLKVAQAFEGRSKEEACSVMAAVSSALGFYDEAIRFNTLAAHWRAAEEAAEAACVES